MSPIRIAVLGGSVAAGTLAKLDVFHDCLQYGTDTPNKVRETQTWWSILGRILGDWVRNGVEIVNATMSGDTAEAALRRVKQGSVPKSDYVLVLLGSDDALAAAESSAFEGHLANILQCLSGAAATPVLITPPPFSERLTQKGLPLEQARRLQALVSHLAQIVRTLAQNTSRPLIDLGDCASGSRLIYDHLDEGWLPDAVAQLATATFVAGEMLDAIGVQGFPKLALCDFRKVYADPTRDNTKHNAFTDLTYFQGEFFVAFRNGRGHGDLEGGDYGSEIVLRSQDGINWVKDAVLQVPNLDNRDPKFLVANGKLILYAPCTRPRTADTPISTTTYGFERLSRGQWGEPFECTECFFWRPKSWRGRYVVAPYVWPQRDAAVKLLASADGRRWEEESVICPYDSYNNETDLWTEGDELVAFSRHDPPEGDHSMQVSTFLESESRWETVSSGRIVQAPCVFESSGRLFVTGRTCAYPHDQFDLLGREFSKVGQGQPDGDLALAEKYHHGLRTGIFVMDHTRARQVAELLSAGDSSYPGVVRYGEEYLISDYSMHEYYRPIRSGESWKTPSDIYVWRMRIA